VILVVEDHPDTARALCRLLARIGYRVECATTADEAWALVRTVKPRLIVLDQMLPGKPGLEVLRELKNDPELADVPVLFYSASYEPATREAAKMLGAADWLVKGDDDWIRLLGRITDLYPPGAEPPPPAPPQQ
jgi:CheY-like chemotaxis protein